MNESSKKYQDKDINRKPSTLQNFFILCSGVDREIIKRCSSEWNKYAGIGATIFFTACLALISGGYAIDFVFENGIYSILFGIFWAIVIFNLDRYIVLSLRKEKIPTKTEIKREIDLNKKEELKLERKRLIWNQALMASPRFIIALIIAFTVSKPIELRLYQDRINKELSNIVTISDKEFEKQEESINKSLNDQLANINKQEANDKSVVFSGDPIYQDAMNRIPILESNINQKEQQIITNNNIISANLYKETRYRTTINSITNQVEKTPYDAWLPNAKAVAKTKENNSLDSELRNLKSELDEQKKKKSQVELTLSEQATAISDKYTLIKDNISQQIENRKKTYTHRKAEWETANKESNDLPARLEALSNISSFGSSIWWASLVITLLFIVLETAPVVIKLLTKRGPYDVRLDKIEYEVCMEESKQIDMLNREINEYMKLADNAAKLSGTLRLKAEKDKLDIELKKNKVLLNKLADYQSEIANIYLDTWFQEEKAKALQQARGLNQQAIHNQKPIKFEDLFWRKKGVANKIEYYFRNGSIADNELFYFENEQLSKGKWNLNNTKDEITVDLMDNKIEYQISELSNTSLKLKDKTTNDIIEFVKV